MYFTQSYINNFIICLQGAVQQLYSVQCEDPLVDLRALALTQCRSVPTNCEEEKMSNLTEVLMGVVRVGAIAICDLLYEKGPFGIFHQC